MKLSHIRARQERNREGQWFFWRNTAWIKVRGFSNPEYQRAARAARLAHPAPTPLDADAPAEAVKERAAALEQREHAIGEMLVPALARDIFVDWWGIDEEAEPISTLPGEPEMETVVVHTYKLETAHVGERIFRREGELWQEMVRLTPALAARLLHDPTCSDLLVAVRSAAETADLRTQQEDALALGKLPRTFDGTSRTETTKKS
jgi:hypothetical protein